MARRLFLLFSFLASSWKLLGCSWQHSGGHLTHLYRMRVPDFSGKWVYFQGLSSGKKYRKIVEIGGLLAFFPEIFLIRGSFQIFLHLGGNFASFPSKIM